MKTKRDGQIDGRTDRRTDRQMDGGISIGEIKIPLGGWFSIFIGEINKLIINKLE